MDNPLVGMFNLHDSGVGVRLSSSGLTNRRAGSQLKSAEFTAQECRSDEASGFDLEIGHPSKGRRGSSCLL